MCRTHQSIVNQLAIVGKPVGEDDLLSYVLSGLNPAFNLFVTSISFALRYGPMSFDDFQSELLSYELVIKSQIKATEQPTFAMLA